MCRSVFGVRGSEVGSFVTDEFIVLGFEVLGL